MFRQVGAWVREQSDPVEIGSSVAIAGLFSGRGFSRDWIARFLALVVVAPIVETVLGRLELAPGLAWSAFGVAWLAAGAVQLRGGDPRIGAAFLAIGFWIGLDGIYGWQHGDPGDASARETDADESADDVSRAGVFRLSRHNRRVVTALREANRPLTAAELRSHTGLSDADLERVLSEHGYTESGPIQRVGNGYVLDDSDTGFSPFLRTAARLVGGRLLRPFRLLRPSG